jgi:hypothetical protein
MARDDFFQNVRTAVRFVAPTVDTDNPYTRPQDLQRRLQEAAVWLTPESVAGFHPQDFGNLPAQQQARLRDAVDNFLAVAQAVPPSAPAEAGQVRKALPSFMTVVTIVQEILRQEWQAAVEQLVRSAEEWSALQGWDNRREEKQISEDFLGTYQVPRLLILKGASRLVLEPVARFVPGGSGMADLAVLPSYDSVTLTRDQGQWFVHPFGKGRRRKWSREAFTAAATELGNLG